MKATKIFATFIIAITFFCSCKTYHITPESLLQQLANTKKEKKHSLLTPFFFPGTISGNSLTEVKVLDKTEREVTLYVTRRMGVRITKKDGKRKTFYFDTLLIQDSLITGKNEHFFGTNIKPINLNNIAKIELQE